MRAVAIRTAHPGWAVAILGGYTVTRRNEETGSHTARLHFPNGLQTNVALGRPFVDAVESPHTIPISRADLAREGADSTYFRRRDISPGVRAVRFGPWPFFRHTKSPPLSWAIRLATVDLVHPRDSCLNAISPTQSPWPNMYFRTAKSSGTHAHFPFPFPFALLLDRVGSVFDFNPD